MSVSGGAKSMYAMMFFLFFLVIGATMVTVALARRSQFDRNLILQRKINEIAHEFPDQVRAWGGKEVLRDPQQVQAIIARLEAS